MAENIDEIANAAPHQQKKEEPKRLSTLESVIDETLHAGKSIIKLGLAASIPFAQATLFPHLAKDTAVMAGAQVAADSTTNFKKGKKTTAGEILKSSAVGTAVTGPVHYAYKFIDKIPLDTALGYVSKAVAWGGLAIPALLGTYQSVDYLVRNVSFRGLGKYLKENYWPTLKRSWKYILPFSLANIFVFPLAWQVTVGAALTYVFALFGAPKKGELKEEEKRDKTPYIIAAANVGTKLVKNTVTGVYDAAYTLGSTVREKLYKVASKPTPSPAAQAA